MKINPVLSAFKSKGRSAFLHRITSITNHYGLNPARMDQAVRQFIALLDQHDCPATFPLTAITLKRYPKIIEKYLHHRIEFAIHGYTHDEISHLKPDELAIQINKALDIFHHAGLAPSGFRSPYLRQNEHLVPLLEKLGFNYISNQPFFWEELSTAPPCTSNPQMIKHFPPGNSFWSSFERLSLPHLENNLVDIPVSFPDDEVLVDRLESSQDFIKKTWLSMLDYSYRHRELFTLQLHPERLPICAGALHVLLSTAHSKNPRIWCATLAEIAGWWKKLNDATVEYDSNLHGEYHFSIQGSKDIRAMARNVQVDSADSTATKEFQQVDSRSFRVYGKLIPVIGVSPYTSPQFVNTLRQQGYVCETAVTGDRYSFYFNQPQFDISCERTIIDAIESSDRPLVRLGRWPNGYQSALAITGDIDALTIWDYGLRLVGN